MRVPPPVLFMEAIARGWFSRPSLRSTSFAADSNSSALILAACGGFRLIENRWF